MRNIGVVVLLGMLTVTACQKQTPAQQAAQPPAGPAPGSTEWKIANAMSAAPASIAAQATILDFPGDPQSQPPMLRAGSNGWTCFPDMTETPGNDPVCFDAVWMDWMAAWLAHKPFHTSVAGVSYMLQGSSDASNTDPYKMKPDSGESWMESPPHIMWISPSPAALDKMSTDPKNGGAWVMFKGTPFAHVMIPVR